MPAAVLLTRSLCIFAFTLSFIGLEWIGAVRAPEATFELARDDPSPVVFGYDIFGTYGKYNFHDDAKPAWAGASHRHRGSARTDRSHPQRSQPSPSCC